MSSNKKGSATYFSDMIMSVFSFGIMFVIVLIVTMTTFFLEYGVEGTVYGNILYKEPVTETMLMNYMDITHDGHRVGDLVTLAVWNGDTTYEYMGEEVDLEKISYSVIFKFTQGAHKLTLVMDGEDYVLDEQKGEYSSRATVMIYAGRKTGSLILER